MQKKIMICVDDSMHAKFAVKYCADLALKATSMTFVLFNVQAAVSRFLMEECRKDKRLRAQLNNVLDRNKEKSESILVKYKEEMVGAGLDEKRISIQSQSWDVGIAKDILKFGEKGRYDAVALGRRGLSSLQEMFSGSVTGNIMQHCTYLPIWLVGGNMAAKKILVLVDGSENALRAIDHLAFIMGGAEDVRITLFHVQPRLSDVCKIDIEKDTAKEMETIIVKSDQQCLESFYPIAMEKFSENGVSPDRIEAKTKRVSVSLKSTIVKEIKNGDYDTIVLGRSGLDKRFFAGSVSSYLMNKVADRVIWIIP